MNRRYIEGIKVGAFDPNIIYIVYKISCQMDHQLTACFSIDGFELL